MDLEDSPRMVTAANHCWECDFASCACAFPSAIFAGGHCGDYSKIAATIATRNANATKTMANPDHRRPPSPWESLKLHLFMPSKKTPGRLRRKWRKGGVIRKIDGPRPLKKPVVAAIESFRDISETTSHQEDDYYFRNPFATTSDTTTAMMKATTAGVHMETQPTVIAHGKSRSQAIAIVSNKSSSGEENGDENEDPNFYDYCTWQMYMRITDHRRRNPIKHRYTYIPSTMPVAEVDERDGCYPEDSSSEKDSSQDAGSGVPEERFFDGEVFELEI